MSEDTEKEVRFLLDRLDDLEPELDGETHRLFAGHVKPSMERLRLTMGLGDDQAR